MQHPWIVELRILLYLSFLLPLLGPDLPLDSPSTFCFGILCIVISFVAHIMGRNIQRPRTCNQRIRRCINFFPPGTL